MARFAHRHSDGIDQFNAVMGAMRGAPDLIELGKDARGEDRFTTREMIETERRLHHAAELMVERERHEVRDTDPAKPLWRVRKRAVSSFRASRPTRWRMSWVGAIWNRRRPCRHRQERDAGRGAGGLGSGGLRGRGVALPASRPKTSKAVGHRVAHHRQHRACGTRAATCSRRAMCW